MVISRIKPRTAAYFVMMLLFIGLAGWLYLHQASEVAGYAREIHELQMEKEHLHRRIVALRGNMALWGSLQRVLQIGDESGYRFSATSDAGERLRIECVPIQRPTSDDTSNRRSLHDGENYEEAGGADTEGRFWGKALGQLKTWIKSPVDEGHAP